MPVDALPQPWDDGSPGMVPLRRTYRDSLGRPMIGQVTITGREGLTVASVVVDLVDGVLDVGLLPGSYTLQAALRTSEGGRVDDNDEVTLLPE